mmetsp:Transcript_106830/g.130287  ORF Transcript_106830/g.130287 Transcript_106830/m.130287 type:complete len:94 (+) Transcript_106830:27-308(+)
MIQKAIGSALDPNSEVVYVITNAAIILLLIVLLLTYLINPSIHFIILGALGTGLLLSVNFVWMNRNPTNKVDDSSKNIKNISHKKGKKKRKKF